MCPQTLRQARHGPKTAPLPVAEAHSAANEDAADDDWPIDLPDYAAA
jgi:hypothetical protein